MERLCLENALDATEKGLVLNHTEATDLIFESSRSPVFVLEIVLRVRITTPGTRGT
jgi:hypothetical protein